MSSKQLVAVARPKRRNKAKLVVPQGDPPMTRAQRRALRGRTGFASRADLPQESQAKIQAIVDNNPDVAAHDYLKTLVYPALNESRIPDSFAQPTALIHDVITIDIPCNFNGDSDNDGRFAVAIQPKLGALSSVDSYKIACVNSSGAWPVNMARHEAFLDTVNGQDIRISPDMQTLTQPQMGTATYFGTDTSTVANNQPFGLSVTDGGGYGLQVPFSLGTLGTQNIFTLSPGYYIMSLSNSDPRGPMSNSSLTVTPFGEVEVDVVSSTPISTNIYNGVYALTVPDSNSELIEGSGIIISATNLADARLCDCAVTFTRSFNDTANITQNAGIVQKLRPVACSALASYVGPELTNGGSIATCFVPGGTLASQFFTANNTPLGNLAAWEKLASIKGAYDGPLKDGAYCWYSPSDISDYNMRRPNDMNDYEYPSIVISGRYTPGATIANAAPVRLIVHTVYEVQTDSLLFESTYQKGSQADMDMVLGHLVGEPHSMANAAHLSFFQRIANGFKTAGQWVYKNRRAIGGAAVSLLPLLA